MSSQRLILPINKCRLTASWKTDAYYNRFGFIHYGVDLISTTGAVDGNRTVYASGEGVVLERGYDNVVGNMLAVLYLDAYNRVTGRIEDVVLRYFHLGSMNVSKWQKVTKDTVLGIYGATGSLKVSPHLHIESDTDIAYPLYSPTVYSSNLLKGRKLGANDKTMQNTLEWLHCKTSPPDWQSYSTAQNSFVNTKDWKTEYIN
ncbi:M23 family metallopeptidase [Oscillospiraceae bacterium MB08-C2-2]|nr:M23 family metallopeptidase [Oscillospiraceae bacterium MB08-C2-2]